MDCGQAVEDRRLCERHSVQTGVQLDDLADLELGLKARGLELNADERFGLPGVGSNVDLADQDRAGRRLEQSLDRDQGACLAGSVWTQKPEDLAFVDIETDPSHRSLGAVADAQVFDLESKTSHRRRFRGHSVYPQGIPLTRAVGCGEGRQITLTHNRHTSCVHCAADESPSTLASMSRLRPGRRTAAILAILLLLAVGGSDFLIAGFWLSHPTV